MGLDSALVSAQWLEEHLDDHAVVILEISIDPLADADYPSGHVPGTHFVYWKDLLWHDIDREFPSPQVIADRLSSLGVSDDTTVALVGDPFQFAACAYWVMTMAGQKRRCRLVDGGRRTWLAEQRPLTTGPSGPSMGDLTVGQEDLSSRIGRDEVRASLGAAGRVLIDIRSPEEYRGERVPHLGWPSITAQSDAVMFLEPVTFSLKICWATMAHCCNETNYDNSSRSWAQRMTSRSSHTVASATEHLSPGSC